MESRFGLPEFAADVLQRNTPIRMAGWRGRSDLPRQREFNGIFILCVRFHPAATSW